MGKVDRKELQKIYSEYILLMQVCNFSKKLIYQLLSDYHLNWYNIYNNFKF